MTASFVATNTVLDRILARKVEEVAALRPQAAELHTAAESAPPARDFFAALRQGANVALIAEIKKASPSKGGLIEDFDPAALAQTYTRNGAAALDDMQLADLHTMIRALGMAALVEVHDEADLGRALRLNAPLIGVNNRDLRTFAEDIGISERLAKLMPAGQVWVAESAIRQAADVARMAATGASAVLVGEGLLKAADIGAQVRQFAGQPRSGSSA